MECRNYLQSGLRPCFLHKRTSSSWAVCKGWVFLDLSWPAVCAGYFTTPEALPRDDAGLFLAACLLDVAESATGLATMLCSLQRSGCKTQPRIYPGPAPTHFEPFPSLVADSIGLPLWCSMVQSICANAKIHRHWNLRWHWMPFSSLRMAPTVLQRADASGLHLSNGGKRQDGGLERCPSCYTLHSVSMLKSDGCRNTPRRTR